jgi:ribosome-associated protein YbcJ (S4-like RNA binding protein)
VRQKIPLWYHDILVNGEKEARRGRKLRHLDEIRIDNEIYVIEQAGVET